MPRFWLPLGVHVAICALLGIVGLARPAHGQARRSADVPPSAQVAANESSRQAEPPPQGLMPDGTQTGDRVNTARQLFASGQFAAAAELLKRVIAVDPKPVHIFNLGQSQRRAGQIEDARASYQRFVELAPQHPSVNEARAYIRELDAIVKQVQQAEEDYRRQLNRTRGELLLQLNQTRGELLSERAQVEALRRDTPVYKRGWFWGALGGALAASVVAGVVVGYVVTRAPEPPPTDTGYIGFNF